MTAEGGKWARAWFSESKVRDRLWLRSFLDLSGELYTKGVWVLLMGNWMKS